ncbi:D-alanine--D-alanine ligase [Paenibacillus cymbidii]|uniref:D-alanine--D-alanine ligase n=1 Tax=Paenibacillus cymbidii TaxID=1639034 RepID=UPI0010801E1C|nr:D-alanine--D-alanine ligase [Paenibacillus cymbidii]
MNNKIRVGLVYGGKSGEHDVSLQTALAVIGAFDHTKYEIKPFFITKQGAWRSGPALTGPAESVAQLTFGEQGAAGGADEASALQPLFATLGGGLPTTGGEAGAAAAGATLDVVLPLLHGTYGEDGTIQGLLEMADIPYVGAGVMASAVGMDKAMMKKVFAQEGLPQCLFRYFTRGDWEKNESYHLLEIETALGYPCFVKPANLGSSVGISKAKNRQELLDAVALAFRYDRKVVVEEGVDAREIEVSVLGNDEPEASVPGEIVPCNEFYDYKAKYVDGNSAMIIPAELPEETAEAVRSLAIRAFKAIDGSGLARVDFFLSRADGRLYINEINTMPGFTPFSMYPLLWKESGKSYPELLGNLIELALKRHEEKRRLTYSFDVGE